VLPVASLAIYTVAVMGGRLVTLFSNPFLQASFPRMCRIARSESPADQARDVLRNAAVLVVIAATCGLPLAAFSTEVLTVWVRDPAIVAAASPVMSIYTVASLLLALASVFYQWQTATGRVGVQVTFNGIALVWFPALLWFMTSERGLTGAAIAWAVYGALALVSNLFATYGRDRLPISTGVAWLRLTVVALVPAAACTTAARLVADAWFAHSIAARIACAALAGLCGGAAAAAVALPHLTHLTERPGLPSQITPSETIEPLTR